MEYEGAIVTYSDDILSSFWGRVAKGGPDECWLWQGHCDRFGRGTFWVKGTGRHTFAPRFSLMLATGEEHPATIFACHTCDNPTCVNPAHLWWGDRSANVRDSGLKGRHRMQARRGAANPQSKLTVAAVTDIRNRYAAGETSKVLAAEYSIHPTNAAATEQIAENANCSRQPAATDAAVDGVVERDWEAIARDLNQQVTKWAGMHQEVSQKLEATLRSPAPPATESDATVRDELAWYGEQARLARLIHSEGDAGRHALAADGGKRARTALGETA